MREFDDRPKHFLCGYHFINSHNHFSLQHMDIVRRKLMLVTIGTQRVKVARYSFSGSIPPKFEHKLRCQKQSFGKIATTVVLDKDENLL